MSTETDFTGNELADLMKLHDAAFDLIEKSGRRLVIEVWNEADTRPIAWMEAHPSDSDLRIRFDRELAETPGGDA